MAQENEPVAADSRTAVDAATEALHRARAELEKAQAFYHQVCQQATERVKAVRATTVGDMLDGTLEAVKRHPVAGLTLAALLGYFLGRLFRR